MFGMEKVEDAIEVEMHRLEKAIDLFCKQFKL
jgi:hypothetical protein